MGIKDDKSACISVLQVLNSCKYTALCVFEGVSNPMSSAAKTLTFEGLQTQNFMHAARGCAHSKQ